MLSKNWLAWEILNSLPLQRAHLLQRPQVRKAEALCQALLSFYCTKSEQPQEGVENTSQYFPQQRYKSLFVKRDGERSNAPGPRCFQKACNI